MLKVPILLILLKSYYFQFCILRNLSWFVITPFKEVGGLGVKPPTIYEVFEIAEARGTVFLQVKHCIQ